MNRKWMAVRLRNSLLLALVFSAPVQLVAQVPVDQDGQPLAAIDAGVYAGGGVPIAGAQVEEMFSLTTVELEELVGPVALYPDDLLAIVLPASTYPLQIVQAVRFLDQFENDSSLEPDESWDESVVALLNYPEVLRMMDQQIDWTWRLGEAVIGQQVNLIAAVEKFRDQAYAAGNLASDDYQTVSQNDGVIEIAPADKEIIYVPYYEPEEVVVYQPRRSVYNYYPQAYPVYNYPYPYGHTFSSGNFWGVTTAFTIGWQNHNLNVYHPSYLGHPYYGYSYYGNYYRRPSISVYNSYYGHNNYSTPPQQHYNGDNWRPRNRSSGARPATRSARNQHYSPGGDDRERSNSRTSVSANNSQRSSASASQRGATRQIGVDRSRRSSADTAGTRPDIRFRDRPGSDSIRANRNSDSRRSTRSNTSRTARPVATPARQASATRTSSRNRTSQRQGTQRAQTRSAASRQSPSQRTTSRAAVQRPASSQRTATRASTTRQASAPRATSTARAQRQSAPRQSASSRGSKQRAQPQRNQSSRQSSSRGSSRRKHRR